MFIYLPFTKIRWRNFRLRHARARTPAPDSCAISGLISLIDNIPRRLCSRARVASASISPISAGTCRFDTPAPSLARSAFEQERQRKEIRSRIARTLR